MESLSKFIQLHNEAIDTEQDQLRLGQRFINMYFKRGDEFSEKLYYQTNQAISINMIRKWLADNHYLVDLPMEVAR